MIEMREFMDGVGKVNRGQLLSLSQCENIGASVEASSTSNPKQIFLYA